MNVVHERQQTFGARLSDRVAQFGGSWPFIILFVGFLALWVGLNAIVLTRWARPFDPFPFIFLNLILSMVAALQAPIILMSQNRQAARDRLAATLDYEINLRAEAEIVALHDRLDQLRIERVEALLREMIERIGELQRCCQPPTSPPA